jgi:hypothetical protein
MKTSGTKWLGFIITLALIAPSTYSMTSQARHVGRNVNAISDRDKAQIIESLLIETLSLSDEDRSRIVMPSPRDIDPCRGSVGSVRTEYILNRNLTVSLLPAVKCVNLVLLDQDELVSKSEEGIQYLLFDLFQARGSKVEVHLSNNYRHGESFWSTGVTYEYRKVAGVWRGKVTGGYGVDT